MRYVEGSDLKELLTTDGALDPSRAIAICSQIGDALDAAHGRGLVHRDVKPSNVLLDESEHAYLADFGLSRRLTDQAPGFESGLSLGTPAYVAPEQIEGAEVDGRADQYSLACLLHECLTGEPPFARSSEAAALSLILEEAPPRPGRPGGRHPQGNVNRTLPIATRAAPAFIADAHRALFALRKSGPKTMARRGDRRRPGYGCLDRNRPHTRHEFSARRPTRDHADIDRRCTEWAFGAATTKRSWAARFPSCNRRRRRARRAAGIRRSRSMSRRCGSSSPAVSTLRGKSS